MHIIIVVLHRPVKPTGVCRFAANLANCLADNCSISKITILIGNWQQFYFEKIFKISSKKIVIIPINIKNNLLSRNLWYLIRLPKIVKNVNPSVVHFAFPIPIFKFLYNKPTFTTIHDLYPFESPENFGYPQVLFNKLFLFLSIMNSNGLSCVSQTTLDKMHHYFPSLLSHNKASVIYNYVDFKGVNYYEPVDNLKKCKFILCVAQHRHNKNIDLLIKSFSTFLSENCIDTIFNDLKLVIVGSHGPVTNSVISLVDELEIKNNVLFLSSIDDYKLCWLYKNCQVFVIPSSTEGFCLPLAEALSFNQQIICSDIPIFREIGRNNCHYFSLDSNSLHNLNTVLFKVLFNSHTIDFNVKDNNRFNKSEIATQYISNYQKINI